MGFVLERGKRTGICIGVVVWRRFRLGLSLESKRRPVFYEIEQERLPQKGDSSILLNSREEPAAIIQTTEVQIISMNKVPAEFAEAEGGGTVHTYSGAKRIITFSHLLFKSRAGNFKAICCSYVSALFFRYKRKRFKNGDKSTASYIIIGIGLFFDLFWTWV